MGGLNPFPNIPYYPGVPALTTPANALVASSPILAITTGALENFLIGALSTAPQWGIFDQDGNQIGLAPNTQSTLQVIGSAALAQLTGGVSTVLGAEALEYVAESRVSDFPIEEGSFASYNKVQMPANPRVTLILQGSANDRTYLLDALEAARISTDLYNVVTPEYTYAGYTIERFNYARRSSGGLTLLVVEVSLKEIRQVTPSYATVPIINPQNAASTPTENNGITQAVPVEQSTALQLVNKLSSGLGSMFP